MPPPVQRVEGSTLKPEPMHETQRTGLPTWAKILIGLVVAFAVLAVVAIGIGALAATRIVRVIGSDSSSADPTTFSSSLRWQKGLLVADVAVTPVGKEGARIVKITSVTLNDVSSDHFVPNLQKPGTLTFPFAKYHGVGGDQEKIGIKYEVPNSGESGGESSLINVPAKPLNSAQ